MEGCFHSMLFIAVRKCSFKSVFCRYIEGFLFVFFHFVVFFPCIYGFPTPLEIVIFLVLIGTREICHLAILAWSSLFKFLCMWNVNHCKNACRVSPTLCLHSWFISSKEFHWMWAKRTLKKDGLYYRKFKRFLPISIFGFLL